MEFLSLTAEVEEIAADPLTPEDASSLKKLLDIVSKFLSQYLSAFETESQSKFNETVGKHTALILEAQKAHNKGENRGK